MGHTKLERSIMFPLAGIRGMAWLEIHGIIIIHFWKMVKEYDTEMPILLMLW